MEFPRDVGAHLEQQHAIVIPTVTAGGGGDGLEVDGQVVDRQNGHSLSFLVASQATLTAAATLTVDATLQHGDLSDGSDMADVPAASQPTGTAGGGTIDTLLSAAGGTEYGAAKFDVDASPLKRYVRLQVTPTLSAGATDTATVGGVAAVGGLVIQS